MQNNNRFLTTPVSLYLDVVRFIAALSVVIAMRGLMGCLPAAIPLPVSAMKL